jgi:hypothetical protein
VLEASDLSPHPGATLASLLDETTERLRDVVLLTHPRNLREPEVAAAARRVAAGTRLFSIAVEGSGCVELAELRRGSPVVLARSRVEVDPRHESQQPAVAPNVAIGNGPGSWRGDIESIGFPFQLGVLGPIKDDRYDLDEVGSWLLAAGSQHGPLHAWRIDGTAAEMLPRAFVEGRALAWVDSVLGIGGGFVVSGWTGARLVAAHYDFIERVCTAHVVDRALELGPWHYLPHLHTIVARGRGGSYHALDLGVGKERASGSLRAATACRLAAGSAFQSAPEIVPPHGLLPAEGRAVRLDPLSGEVIVQFAPGRRRGYTPQSDGGPMLRGGRIVQARAGGQVIAALVRTSRQSYLVPFVNQHGTPIDAFSLPARVTSFRLSHDGRFVSYPAGERQLKVRQVGDGALLRFVTPPGKSHSTLEVAIGRGLLTVTIGKHAHLIRWDQGTLELARNEERDPGKLLARAFRSSHVAMVSARSRPKPSLLWRRFVAGCSAFGLVILVDIFGQIAVLDRNRQLVAMFFVFRDQVAAWMPDGTRFGPVAITGGPSAPDGPQRIGAALVQAMARSQETTQRGELRL